MKSINLDEMTDFESIYDLSGSCATKRDILRSDIYTLEEIVKNPHTPEEVLNDVFSFIAYCKALVNEKGDTV